MSEKWIATNKGEDYIQISPEIKEGAKVHHIYLCEDEEICIHINNTTYAYRAENGELRSLYNADHSDVLPKYFFSQANGVKIPKLRKKKFLRRWITGKI